MNHLLKLKIARMGIGDSLISSNGYAIDYVDGSGGTFHEPCYMLRRGFEIIYMSKNEREADRKALVDFLYPEQAEKQPQLDWWGSFGMDRPRDEWRLEPSGSDSNPVWDYPIGQLTVRDHQWLFANSPYTGCLKTHDWLQVQRNHYPCQVDGSILGVRTQFFFNGKVQLNDTFMRGRVFAVVEKQRKSASPPLGFIQLISIDQRTIGSVTKSDLHAMGLKSFEQLPIAKYQPSKPYWVFEYRVVWTDETLIPKPAAVKIDATPLQASFLPAV